MKKLIIVLAFMLTSVSLLIAQPVKTARIKLDEVPVAVKAAFEKDFGKIPAEGYWTVAFYVVTEGSRTAAKPVTYTYVKGKKANKIEVRYTPEGKLEGAKGLEKTNTNA